MANVQCLECGRRVEVKLLKHYEQMHPKLYKWAVRLNVTHRQTRRLFGK